MNPADENILAEQLAYYRARASEYDEWFQREGRYDHGHEHRRLWFEEVAVVEDALVAANPSGEILELACGTGIWTSVLARAASHLTAVDASPEVLQINSSRVGGARVEYVQADLFRWVPSKTYDFVFFAFWLSHVPEERFEAFWSVVKRSLRPGGRAFFIDSLAAPEGTARDQRVEQGGIVERRLNDGRTYRVVKIFHEPPALQERLRKGGWEASVRATPRFFIYGTAR
jgi:demethylmenaquinone methyltransferase/2-methoxy-6-polyprenyl-1,4-benzoquinol methylase